MVAIGSYHYIHISRRLDSHALEVDGWTMSNPNPTPTPTLNPSPGPSPSPSPSPNPNPDQVDEWIMCMKVLRIKDDAYPSGKIYAQAIPIVSIPIVSSDAYPSGKIFAQVRAGA